MTKVRSAPTIFSTCILMSSRRIVMSLLSLPNEILDYICNDFPKHTYDKANSKALYDLCLTCKNLCEIAQPHLYHGFGDHHGNLQPLWNVLPHKPHLLASIESLVVTLSHDRYVNQTLAMSLLTRAGDLYDSFVGFQASSGELLNVDAWLIEHLLRQLKCVRSLVLDIHRIHAHFKDSPDSSLVLPTYKSFKSLTLYDSQWEESESLDFNDIHHILKACCQLQELTIQTPRAIVVGGGLPQFPRLERLDMCCGGIVQADFRYLVRSCPDLKRFHYSIYHKEPTISPSITAQQLFTVLRGRKHTLLEVAAKVTDCLDDDSTITNGDVIEPVSSLRDFTSLKSLSIGLADLSGLNHAQFIHKLPPQLEELHVGPGEPEDFFDELLGLATIAEKDFPQLRQVTTDGFDEGNEVLDDEVFNAFQEAAVMFEAM